jgi:hypothetical protein
MKVHFVYKFTTVSELRRFYVGVVFIIGIVDFFVIQTIRFSTICQLSFVFAMEEILPFIAF